MTNLDDKTRGYIEQTIDMQLEPSRSFREDYGWIFEVIPTSSEKEYLIGCVVGELQALIWGTLIKKEPDPEDVQGILKRRLPEIEDKINRELNI